MRSKLIYILKENEESDRYLIELLMPTAEITYRGLTHSKELLEDDCLLLMKSDFAEWKKVVIN